MRPLSIVQAFPVTPRPYEARVRVLFALLLVLLIAPGWSGDERLALPADGARLAATRVDLRPGDGRTRVVGRLRYLGGVALASRDPAFGSYSALHVMGDRFVMVGDGGNLLAFRMGGDWRPRLARQFPLPGGPGTGWRKGDRDSESIAHDPATGRWWIGFENLNEIWRYAPGFARAERGRAPPEMRRWPQGGGAEAMTRLSDGRFLMIAELARLPRGRDGRRPSGRVGLIFRNDPTRRHARPALFTYLPGRGHDPVGVAELPDGRLLVLERDFDLPFRWLSRLVIVERGAVRPGARVRGREIARLGPPLVSDNFEGVAAVREDGRTVVWLVSDDNGVPVQRTLLLKFALDG